MSGVSMTPGWEVELSAKLQPKLHRLSERMLEGAVRDCPVGTSGTPEGGDLRDHMYSKVLPDGTVVLGNDAEYALDVEYGHHIPKGDTPNLTAAHGGFVEPQPFLRPQAYRYWGTL